MGYLDTQAKKLLQMEAVNRNQVLSSVLAARQEIVQLLSSKESLFYAELKDEIDGILSRVQPELSGLPFLTGQIDGTEQVNQASGSMLSTPALDLQALAAINLEAQNKISQVNDLLKETVGNQLRISVALGESIHQATERIATTGFRRALWRYELIARTVTNEMHNAGSLATYRQLANKHDKLNIRKQWDSVLDKRTSAPCVAQNGEIQPIDKPFSLGRMYPPQLPNCRSRIVAITAKYDDSPSLNDVRVGIGDRSIDKQLSKGLDKLKSIPGIQQGYTDYNRVLYLNDKLWADRATELAEIDRLNKLGLFNEAEALRIKTIKAWEKTSEGKSFLELKERLNQVTDELAKMAKTSVDKEVKAQLIFANLRNQLDEDQYKAIRDTVRRSINFLPESVVKIVPDDWRIGDSSKIVSVNGKPTYISLARTTDTLNLQRSAIHEVFHTLEKSGKTRLSQAVSLRDKLATDTRVIDGDIIRIGQGIAWRGNYAGRVYEGDKATEIYSVTGECLLKGINFFTAITQAPNPLCLLLSHLDI